MIDLLMIGLEDDPLVVHVWNGILSPFVIVLWSEEGGRNEVFSDGPNALHVSRECDSESICAIIGVGFLDLLSPGVVCRRIGEDFGAVNKEFDFESICITFGSSVGLLCRVCTLSLKIQGDRGRKFPM